MQAIRDGLQAWSDHLRNFLEKRRQSELESLRTREQRLNEREEYLKRKRRSLRLNGLWDGGLKAFVGWGIMEIAMEKRDLQEKIKELEDEAKDI